MCHVASHVICKRTKELKLERGKKERVVKQKTLNQGCSSEERDEVVGKKRRFGAAHKDGNTCRRKKTKGLHNDQLCTTVEVDIQPCRAQ